MLTVSALTGQDDAARAPGAARGRGGVPPAGSRPRRSTGCSGRPRQRTRRRSAKQHRPRILYATQGADRPADVHALRHPRAPADVPALPRAQDPGGVRPRARPRSSSASAAATADRPLRFRAAFADFRHQGTGRDGRHFRQGWGRPRIEIDSRSDVDARAGCASERGSASCVNAARCWSRPRSSRPSLIALVFGAMELGYAYYGKLTVEHMSIAGARAGIRQRQRLPLRLQHAAGGQADAKTGMGASSITKIVVYRATGPSDRVPHGVQDRVGRPTRRRTAAATSTPGADLALASTDFGCVGPPGPTIKMDQFWCPTDPQVGAAVDGANGPPDYIGVYVEGVAQEPGRTVRQDVHVHERHRDPHRAEDAAMRAAPASACGPTHGRGRRRAGRAGDLRHAAHRHRASASSSSATRGTGSSRSRPRPAPAPASAAASSNDRTADYGLLQATALGARTTSGSPTSTTSSSTSRRRPTASGRPADVREQPSGVASPASATCTRARSSQIAERAPLHRRPAPATPASAVDNTGVRPAARTCSRPGPTTSGCTSRRTT